MAPMNILLFFLAIWLSEMTVVPVSGQSIKFPRIVGDQNSVEELWSWHVSIWQDYEPQCVGSLLNDQWVLSAAHCFSKNFPLERYTILLGAHQHLCNRSDNIRSVEMIFFYPNSEGNVGSFGDIVLLKLDSPVKFSSEIFPINLPMGPEDFFYYTDCWVAGWGLINHGEELPDLFTLQAVKVPILNRRLCNRLFNKFNSKKDHVKEDLICAGYKSEWKDACEGKSGETLVCKNNGYWTQVGIVSWGEECAELLHHGIFYSLSSFYNWISSTISRG